MNVNIVATNIELTEAIKAYVLKKLKSVERLLDTTKDKEIKTKVELGKVTKRQSKGIIFAVEVHMSHRKNEFTASAKASDLYAAIDIVKDELMREIKSVKGKKEAEAKKGASKIKKIMREEI
ncbi:MAG: ribosomal subunit interface protein [Candidatus Vogelbacteria bacterium CG10_big_fil_rev_8_21_14_0_10_45_14]|uniref:Ribosomal subunit interface protein n=1 Tax=Candidatus Vogelbacteria bacterium CG10_big_fil_rev_8_21_14_0_10_45_14 TaxID=1975042 RepID=A0A2H0RKC2_9BACT|nr:MAG: ribosomal subunit interface protein [Candidatus Vogelbacteria bacterium CG10_big_fil_rev_8_21_14_0_10_45_14]